MRRLVRIGALLMVLGLMGVVHFAAPRRRLLMGLVFGTLPVILRDSLWGLVFLMVFLLYLPPWSPEVG